MQPRLHGLLGIVDVVGHLDAGELLEFGDGVGADEIGPVVDDRAASPPAAELRRGESADRETTQRYARAEIGCAHRISVPSQHRGPSRTIAFADKADAMMKPKGGERSA